MTLGFFSIAAIDILGELQRLSTDDDRAKWIDWVYSNQLPTGGFRGSPATFLYGASPQWDPPTLPASFFALVTLVTLGDELERIDKRGLLTLLPKMQRADGSFGEWLGPGGEVVGGSDMRFIYFASAIRWILRGRGGHGVVEGVLDFDVDRCVDYIKSSEVSASKQERGMGEIGTTADDGELARHMITEYQKSHLGRPTVGTCYLLTHISLLNPPSRLDLLRYQRPISPRPSTSKQGWDVLTRQPGSVARVPAAAI